MATGEDMDVLKTAEDKQSAENKMNKEQNKCVILRKLMTLLDNILVNGVNGTTGNQIAEQLRNYRGEQETFDVPTVDDFIGAHDLQHRVLNAVMMDLNKSVVMPVHVGIPVPVGTLLFALHEYQHRYHEDDDQLLVDGLSTLEYRARNCIEDQISRGGWSFVQSAIYRVYQSAVDGHLIEMAYRLIDVRQALREWLSPDYVNIFIDSK